MILNEKDAKQKSPMNYIECNHTMPLFTIMETIGDNSISLTNNQQCNSININYKIAIERLHSYFNHLMVELKRWTKKKGMKIENCLTTWVGFAFNAQKSYSIHRYEMFPFCARLQWQWPTYLSLFYFFFFVWECCSHSRNAIANEPVFISRILTNDPIVWRHNK